MTSDKKFAIRILDENVIFAFPIDFVTEFFIFFISVEIFDQWLQDLSDFENLSPPLLQDFFKLNI